MKLRKRDKNSFQNKLILFSIAMAFAGTVLYSYAQQFRNQDIALTFDKQKISKMIGSALHNREFPEVIEVMHNKKQQLLKITYTLDQDLQNRATLMLKRYKPDYGAVVVFDASTGGVLSLADSSEHDLNHTEYGNLALRALFPAASVFKIVTAAAVMDEQRMSPDTIIPFNGRNHTLYKKNVNSTTFNRHTRYTSLKEAFALSINTVFGKVGLQHIGGESLLDYAHRFGFNIPVLSDFPFESGTTRFLTDDDWNVVEVASGYYRDSTLSPVHGALIASSIANDGVMMSPHIIKEIFDIENNETVYRAKPEKLNKTLGTLAANQMRELMQETVERGTSRSSFRQIFGKRIPEAIQVGGKTGSLTSIAPAGKVDWFVGYGMLNEKKIGVAVLTVNGDLWRVKSSYLAGDLIRDYFRDDLKKISKRKIATE